MDTDLTDDYQLYRIHSTQGGKASSKPFVLRIQVDDQPIEMEIDTGTSVSILSSATYKENFSEKPLQASSVVLRTYAEDPLTNLGSLTVEVQHNAQKMKLPLLVVEGNGPNLLGRDWLEKLRIDWRSIHHVTGTEADSICQEFPEVFQEGLGTLKGFEATIHVDQDVNPVFCKARPVPYALKLLVEQELANLEKDGVISPIAFSDWAAPIVPVLKSNRSVRICGDFKLTVNKVSKLDRYPIPWIEDLFSKLSGGQRFTKLDLSQAYQQISLEEDSKKYVVVNTHKGLYQYNRLPYGISSAPGIFQHTMECLLQGIPHVVVYLDDILITGQTQEDHPQVCYVQIVAKMGRVVVFKVCD